MAIDPRPEGFVDLEIRDRHVSRIKAIWNQDANVFDIADALYEYARTWLDHDAPMYCAVYDQLPLQGIPKARYRQMVDLVGTDPEYLIPEGFPRE